MLLAHYCHHRGISGQFRGYPDYLSIYQTQKGSRFEVQTAESASVCRTVTAVSSSGANSKNLLPAAWASGEMPENRTIKKKIAKETKLHASPRHRRGLIKFLTAFFTMMYRIIRRQKSGNLIKQISYDEYSRTERETYSPFPKGRTPKEGGIYSLFTKESTLRSRGRDFLPQNPLAPPLSGAPPFLKEE